MSVIIKEEWNQKEYLVARLEEGECLDEDCLAAVGNEQDAGQKAGIEGILPVSYGQLMEERVLRYDINAYQPFTEYKRQIRQGKTLAGIFLSILDTYAAAEAYLLEPSYFLLRQDYIYVNPETCRAWLVICPVYRAEDASIGDNGDLRTLFRDMLRGIRLDNEDMAFYGNLTYELDKEEAFNRVTFRSFLTGGAGRLGGIPEKKESILPEREIPRQAQEHGGGKKVLETPAPAIPVPASGSVSGAVFKPTPAQEPKASAPKKGGGGFLKGLLGGKQEKGNTKKTDSETGKKQKNTGGIRLPDEEELPLGFGDGAGKASSGERTGREDFGEAKKETKTKKEKRKKEPSKKEPVKPVTPVPPVLQTDDEPMIPLTDDELPGENGGGRRLFLKQSDTGEMIPVVRFPFEIGREGSGLRVDLSKTKVSRKHAVIDRTKEGYTIRDISRHGTFLDGCRIEKDTDMPLENGMRILLKEIEYLVVVEED